MTHYILWRFSESLNGHAHNFVEERVDLWRISTFYAVKDSIEFGNNTFETVFINSRHDPDHENCIAIAISILIKFEIAISIAISKKIADRDLDRSFAIVDRDRDQFTYC